MKTTQYVQQEKAIAAAFDPSWYTEQEAKIQAAPRRARTDDGHIYVVEFGSGVLKVGKATNPKSRLANHAMYARIHGGTVRRSWVSERHHGYSETERQLIAFCRRSGVRVVGEHFRDVSFEDARFIAGRLAHDAKRRDYLNSLIEAAGGDLSVTWQNAHDRAAGDTGGGA